MANIKTIDWDKIRADYVLNPSYPSFDEIAKIHGISKPLILSKANDLNDPINRGKSWIQQRQSYIEKKQQIQEDIATSEAKSSVKNFVKVLNNMGLKAFKIINRELDYIDKVQADDMANNRPLSMRKQVKMSDITKIVDVLQKIAGGEGAKEILVKLELANKQADNRSVKLQELSDEDFKQVEYQIKNGGAQAIETDYEEVEVK
jgi:23S rRNA G2069 N7-methylase RlmK/C1962 C5-methylase RlmI